MADEDITLDGKPLQSLRVADLKAALEQRNLPKSGQKNTLVKRLKGALMLENLQKSSSSHSGLQPNSQIGEEMCQNSFIKQYLAQQQELLRQRLEREAQQEQDADESPAVHEEDEDHSEDNDNSSYTADKQRRSMLSQPTLARPEERAAAVMLGPGSGLLHQESSEDARKQRANFLQGFNEATAPSPPRAVASLSVRVVGQPDRQGLPPAVPRPQEKEGTAPSEPGSAHPVLHLSRSAGGAAGSHAQEDSDEGDDGDDESDDDEDWGPGPGGVRRGNRAPPPPQQMAPSVSSAAARSKRKLQPPQHIPPPQVHHTPMQLRHPTPPPSPPPNLFPLPDTPKQSPPDEPEGEGPIALRGQRVGSFPPPAMQRQDSDSSSRSSSPEPPAKRRPGPLSLLAHKMESEGAFRAAEAAAAAPGMSGETAHSSGDPSQQAVRMKREMEEERRRKEEEERERERQQELEREKKRLEEEREKERKRLEEERKQRQNEEQEKERKRQDEENERKRLEEEKRRAEKKLKEEQARKQERANKVVVTISQDSGSSSDSDSKSDSSSRSSHSSSSPGDTNQTARQMKKASQRGETEDGAKMSKGAEKRYPPTGEVSEPSAAAVTEVEPESEGSIAQQPASGAEPDNSEGRLEESTTPKAFAARKISLTSSKTSPGSADGGAADDSGSAAGRKRRWGSSTAVTAKKPSISITTDSLKSLIPDIKVNQEAVVDLHAEELQSSGEEENLEANRDDPDKGLKIRRTVTQVVPGDNQENGQTVEGEEEDEGEAEQTEREKPRRASKDKRSNSISEDVAETQPTVDMDGEAKKITPSDSLVRRSISQQKSGVSITIDDPVRATRQPSPPRGKLSKIIHVTNLVRPFTLGQLKELLNRTGSIEEDGFWIDKIKSHCFVTYATIEEAVATRASLHGVKWPTSNPKVLNVDFSEQDELDFHKGILKPDKEEELVPPPSGPPARLPPLMPERERDRGVRDLWAEREREMERRERARGEREWDRDKVREFARPGEDGRRSRSRERERRRRERAKSKERKSDKKEKGDEPPAKLLDDLFLKTKAAPCIYWLPLTEEQAAQRVLDRTERQKERERRRKEQEEEDKKRDEEKKDRLKGREKEGGVAAAAGPTAAAAAAVAVTAAGGRVPEGDRERGHGRDREREGDKRRDSSHRSRRPSPGAGSGRRSRSRSNPRDRRR